MDRTECEGMAKRIVLTKHKRRRNRRHVVRLMSPLFEDGQELLFTAEEGRQES